jgi:hypothetical protein
MNPFVPVEVTGQAKEYRQWVDENIRELNRIQESAQEVMVKPGRQCHNPYDCWYSSYCHDGTQTDEEV